MEVRGRIRLGQGTQLLQNLGREENVCILVFFRDASLTPTHLQQGQQACAKQPLAGKCGPCWECTQMDKVAGEMEGLSDKSLSLCTCCSFSPSAGVVPVK